MHQFRTKIISSFLLTFIMSLSACSGSSKNTSGILSGAPLGNTGETSSGNPAGDIGTFIPPTTSFGNLGTFQNLSSSSRFKVYSGLGSLSGATSTSNKYQVNSLDLQVSQQRLTGAK